MFRARDLLVRQRTQCSRRIYESLRDPGDVEGEMNWLRHEAGESSQDFRIPSDSSLKSSDARL